MRSEFEKKIIEFGFSYKCIADGVYILSQKNDSNIILNAQLIDSEPIEEVIQVSNNGNEIDAIGSFKLKLQINKKEPYFLILAFQNTSSQRIEYITIPKRELMRRLRYEKRISTYSKEVEIVFWLMHDRSLYDCSNLGAQGEWYFLSKGLHGRTFDHTVWDYTEFLNNWGSLNPL